MRSLWFASTCSDGINWFFNKVIPSCVLHGHDLINVICLVIVSPFVPHERLAWLPLC